MIEFLFGIVSLAVLAVVIGLLIAGRYQRVTIYDYQRGLRYREGRFVDLVPPGSYWVFRPTTVIRAVDVRSGVLPIPGQELVTSDGITVKVSLAVQRRLVDPAVAINEVENYTTATYTIIQVALREVVSGMTIDEFMAGRTGVGAAVMERSHDPVRKVGVELESVDVKDVMLPAPTKRLLAQIVEARQRGLAALEKARGETAALRSLANAARLVEENPAILQLRLLEQLESSSGNTVLVGMPAGTTPVPVRPGRPTATAEPASPSGTAE
jgi:regulator of protease activity HflC (stomatin/prohibitin superfamily)